MNREILFCGKRKDNGEWVYGYYLRLNNKSYISQNPKNERGIEITRWAEVIPETVGEYTGLTDKNGKKMFEDDYCLVTRSGVMALGVIEYKDACFWFVESKIQADDTRNMIRLCDLQRNGYEIQVKYNIHTKDCARCPLKNAGFYCTKDETISESEVSE